MNTRPHCKISPPIGIVGLSNIGSITDRLRIGFEVSRRNAACQIHKLSCWISLGAMTVEPTNSTNSNRCRQSARVDLPGNDRPLGVWDDPASAEA